MALDVWLAFFVASWLISLSPGAGAISCMAAGLRYGYRRALWNIVGLQIGILFVLVIVAIGLGAIIAASTTLFLAIKWLGAAYLVFLGIQQWRAPAKPIARRRRSGHRRRHARQAGAVGLPRQRDQPQGHRVHAGGAAAVHRSRQAAIHPVRDLRRDAVLHRPGRDERLHRARGEGAARAARAASRHVAEPRRSAACSSPPARCWRRSAEPHKAASARACRACGSGCSRECLGVRTRV